MPRPTIHGYLKYWKVVRYFIKSKYNLSQAELDMLLFLCDEEYFNKDKFIEFNNLLKFNSRRFDELHAKGWIETIRPYDKKNKALYTVSYKAKRVVNLIYKKLSGEAFPVGQVNNNNMFKAKVGYSDKVHRNMILKINKSIKQQQHHSPE
tara:strand:- start:1692 stop:2141 length:450 start_codon:yes stop_codon:yes gene_type:complete